MSRQMTLWSAGLLLGALVLSGCGGGGGHSGDSRTTIHGDLRSGDATLPNNNYGEAGSYVDTYSCTARDSGTAQVEMKSSDVDSLLVIGVENSDNTVTTVAVDDNSGGGRDAKARFNVQSGVHYFVAATNSEGNGNTGAYTLDFSDNLRDVIEQPKVTPEIRAAAARAVRENKAKTGAQSLP